MNLQSLDDPSVSLFGLLRGTLPVPEPPMCLFSWPHSQLRRCSMHPFVVFGPESILRLCLTRYAADCKLCLQEIYGLNNCGC